MAYLLTTFTAYQFLFRVVRLQGSLIYFAINPYLLLLPLIFIWLGAVILVGKRLDRNLLVGWLLLLIFPSVMLRSFNGQAAFFFLYLRGLQFFWGPLLIIPGLLGMFRAVGFLETSDDTTRRYIKIIATIAGLLTLFELLAVDILKIPPLTFPWIGVQDNPAASQNLNPFRPWGLPSYPQPNALILAYLFWLAIAYHTSGTAQKLVTLSGVILSGSGTGQLALGALAPLVLRRPALLATLIVIPFIALVTWATVTRQFSVSGGAIGRFDAAYAIRLAGLFAVIGQRFLSRFDFSELLFGSTSPTPDSVVGLTHDWAYLDVFYVYGFIGLVGYILLNGGMLFLSLPMELGSGRKLYFSLIGLALNFHYGTLNFYVGQFLFSSLAALQLNRLYSLASVEKPSRAYLTPAVAQNEQ